jgi:hypothetical protein
MIKPGKGVPPEKKKVALYLGENKNQYREPFSHPGKPRNHVNFHS